MTRFLQKAVAVSALCAFAWLGACSDEPAGPGSQDSASPNLDGPILSDAVSAAQAAVRAASGSALASAEGEVAYVALPPGAEPSGSQAILRRVGDATSLTAQVVDGGFDPVPVPAEAGDSIEILVTDVGGATLLQIRIAVLPRRPPIIVRTDPPRDKTDVPLNSLIVVVFNEPVDTGSVTSSSVQLFRGATPIAGGARLLQGTRTAAVFEPSSSLDPNTEYELVVTNEVRDFDGDALAASVSVAFTTGSTLLGSVSSVRVRPDSLVLPVGQQFQLTATAHDEQQNVIVGHPVVWSSSDPLIATVSAAGLVTGIAEGGVQIEAQVDGHTGSVGIRVSEAARPIGAVTITPDSTGVEVGQDVILRAELRDTAGAIIDENRPVTWTSLNPAVATVTSDVPRAATVTGVAEGRAQIVATAEGKADTAIVDVGPPPAEGAIRASARPVSSSRVDVTWVDNATNEDGFRVERSLDLGTTWTVEFTTSGTRVSDDGRSSEQEVCYRVIAFNALGDFAPSNIACTTPPAAPSDVTAVGVAGQLAIDLAWMDNSAVEERYEVLRAKASLAWSVVADLPPNTTSYRDLAVAPDTTYWYRVRANKDGGGSDSSSTLSAIAATAPPVAPSITVSPYASTVIGLHWRDNSINEDGLSLAEGFRVERSTDGETTWATAFTVDVPVTPPFRGSYWGEDAGRASEVEVCYRVFAFNNQGDSSPSNTDCATPLAAPTAVTAIPVDDWTIEFQWTDNSAFEAAYDVYGPCKGGWCYYTNTDLYAQLPANITSYRHTLPEVDENRVWYSGCTFIITAVSDDWDLGWGYSDWVYVSVPGTPSPLCESSGIN